MAAGWKAGRHLPVPFTASLSRLFHPSRHSCGLLLLATLIALFYLFLSQDATPGEQQSQRTTAYRQRYVFSSKESVDADRKDPVQFGEPENGNKTKEKEIVTVSTGPSGKTTQPSLPDLKIFPTENCSAKYLFGDFHASKYGGGVGNFMFEWISFLGIAKTVNRIPALHVRNDMVQLMLKWQKMFPNILDNTSIKLLRDEVSVEYPFRGCCRYVEPRDVYKKHANVTNVFTRFVYMQSYFYFKTAFTRAELFRLLLFHEDDKRVAREEMVSSKFNLNSTYNVCVHIRRGDFVKSKLHQHSTEEFTSESIRFGVDYARTKTNRSVAAILLGNDLEWEKRLVKTMGDLTDALHVANQNSKYWPPHVDWIFSQLYCDTVILTASASTYGWWLGHMSRGDHVLYNAQYSRKNGVERELDEDKFWPSHWRRIRQNEKTKRISFV